MIYMRAGESHVIILNSENIEKIKKGLPAVTFDNSVCIGWTPDQGWLQDKIAATDGDIKTIAGLIQESLKRPEAPTPEMPAKTHHEFPPKK